MYMLKMRKERRRGLASGSSRRLLPMVMALEGRELLSTLTVSNTNDSGADSLRAAIGQANADGGGDTIVFSSKFNTPRTITLTGGSLLLTGTATTTITGPGANLLTVSGNMASGVFDIEGGLAAISGVTIARGSADSGAGVLNNSGTLTLTDASLIGNSATEAGGGVATVSAATTTLIDCTLRRNSAGNSGGGVFQNAGRTTLINCTLSGNSAISGGGLYNNLGNTSLINCTVSGNLAVQGGGLTDSGDLGFPPTITLTNTIVAAQVRGADILVQYGLVTGSYNLIGDGSGISDGVSNLLGTPANPIDPLLAPLRSNGGPTSTMALLPGSPALGKAAAVAALSSSGVQSASSTSINVANGLDFANSSLPTLNSGYFVIQVDSEQMAVVGFTLNADDSATLDVERGLDGTAAATHSGGAAVFLASDQRGYTRGSTVAPDIGAFQSQGVTLTAPPVVEVTTKLDVVNHVDGLTSLRAAIAYANSHPGPDTIIFDPAYFGTERRTIRLVGGPLVLTDPATTTIIGPGAKRLTFRGNGRGSVFEIQGGSLALSGLTIACGRAENGGGIWNDGGKLSLTDVILRNNSARVLGGGLFNNGDATLTNVTVAGDSASVGGGIANEGSLSLTHVSIRRNGAGFASGLFNSGTIRLLSRRLPSRSAGGHASTHGN